MTSVALPSRFGRRVLVTGGAGFIGSHLVDSLLARGYEVIVLDDFSAGSEENLTKAKPLVHVRAGDVRDSNVLGDALERVGLVYHLAANASVPVSVDRPALDFETNALGTQRLLLAARDARVGRVVVISSAAVYGRPDRTPIPETHPLRPISPYGASKLAAESLALAYRQVFGMDVVICRIFNTFGPRQRRYVMHDFVKKLTATPWELTVRGDGSQIRDYLHVSDTVRALIAVAERGEGVYNIGSGTPVSISEVAEVMVRLISPGARIVYGEPNWKGDISVLHANIGRLRGLGFQPEVDLLAGIGSLLEERRVTT